jgi:hypothetical protein
MKATRLHGAALILPRIAVPVLGSPPSAEAAYADSTAVPAPSGAVTC